MEYGEALKVVRGVIRFQRALERIEEMLEAAQQAEQALSAADRKLDAINDSITEAEARLAQVTAAMANREAEYRQAQDEAARRAEVLYRDTVKTIEGEINSLKAQAADLAAQIAADRAAHETAMAGLTKQRDEAQAAAEAEEVRLEKARAAWRQMMAGLETD